jgi:enoyl-CoA hydratase/carnithine racemase
MDEAEAPAPSIDVQLVSHERGVVATMTVDNRRKLNTLNSKLMSMFVRQVEALAGREDLRALVLTGAGDRAFIGGASIDEMVEFDHVRAEQFITRLHRCCECLRQLPVPVIARIDGYALGGGLEVAVSCDLRVATTRAKFGMPEVKVGLPSVIEAALLPHLIGWGRTRELLYTGETIDAETALRWGLVERVVPPDQLDREVDKLVGSLLAAGPHALRSQKRLMQQWETLPIHEAIGAGIDALVRSCDTDEPKRLMSAFLNRKR